MSGGEDACRPELLDFAEMEGLTDPNPPRDFTLPTNGEQWRREADALDALGDWGSITRAAQLRAAAAADDDARALQAMRERGGKAAGSMHAKIREEVDDLLACMLDEGDKRAKAATESDKWLVRELLKYAEARRIKEHITRNAARQAVERLKQRKRVDP